MYCPQGIKCISRPRTQSDSWDETSQADKLRLFSCYILTIFQDIFEYREVDLIYIGLLPSLLATFFHNIPTFRDLTYPEKWKKAVQ